MAKSDEVYIVRRSFSPDGRRIVRRGTRVLGNDRLYRDNRDYFIRADDDLRDDVEQATAAPGEKRNLPPKKELLRAAKKVGADVSESDTKATIADAIVESVEG